jgi:hypothetical protein
VNDIPDSSHEPSPPEPTGRSRYEDFDLSPPAAPPPLRRRTPTLVLAAVVLGFSGVLPLLTVVLFKPGGSVAVALLGLGVAELIGCGLVAALHPLGRPVGLVLGAVGVILGVVAARGAPANGLITMALNGFVIYALASSGPAFRRG